MDKLAQAVVDRIDALEAALASSLRGGLDSGAKDAALKAAFQSLRDSVTVLAKKHK